MRARPLLLAVLGLVLLAAGLWCWWSGADLSLHRALRLGSGPVGVRRVAELSVMGGLAIMGPVALATTAVLLLRHRARDAVWLALAVSSGRLAVEAIKLVVQRPRPPVPDRLELVTSWSFPSAHSAGTALTCLLIAALIDRGWAWLAAAVVAGVIGWSRVALAVHWPGDVLAGWGIALLWSGAAIAIRRRWGAARP